MARSEPVSTRLVEPQPPRARFRQWGQLLTAFILMLSPACGSGDGAGAGRKPPTTTSKPAPLTDARALFDGKTLAGWKAVGGGKWSVVDGEIIGETGDGRYGWLITERPFADFVLELECRHEAAGNSGIQFRSHMVDGEMHGYQAEFDPRPDHGTGGVYEEKGRKWLAKPDARGLAAMKPYEWNRYRIQAIGDHVQLAVNDVVTVDFHDGQARSGIIALQVHSGATPVKVRWRSIRIQDLGEGKRWTPLLDGKTLAGWHVHGEPDVWRVENGEIIGELVRKSPYAYLVTDKQFADFELRLKMLFESKEGNSGIFFRCSFPPHCANCGHVARELPEDVKKFKCPKCGHTETLAYNRRVHIHGPQAEFAPQNTGGLYDSGAGGWINEDKITDFIQKLHRLGRWNDFRVKAVGDHVTVYLNGYRVSDVSDHPFARAGHIALQLHAGGAMKVRFKDIYVRPAGDGEK